MADVLVLNVTGLPISVLPLSTLCWQDSIRAIWLSSVKVLAEYDDWEVHSPSTTFAVPSVVMTTRYISQSNVVRFSRENVFLRDGFRCQYCNNQFHESDLTLDHVRPISYGGKSNFENLVAACSPCNNKRGADLRIKPNKMPHQPSYYEMVERRKEFPLEVPHESWVEYLMWPENNIKVKPRHKIGRKMGMTSLLGVR